MKNAKSAGDVFDVVFLWPFFPRDVLDEIWGLTESFSDDFPTYSSSSVLKWSLKGKKSFSRQYSLTVGAVSLFRCCWRPAVLGRSPPISCLFVKYVRSSPFEAKHHARTQHAQKL